MNLDKESLMVLSDCILFRMGELSNIRNVSEKFLSCINIELATLQDLNSKVCKELQLLNIKSKNTEQ